MNSRGNPATISHEGIVQKADNKSVTVSISSSSACAGCHAEGSCSLSGREEKTVVVIGDYPYKAGDRVDVVMQQSLGYRAVFLGYLLPGIIVIATLVTLVASGVAEWLSGLVSLSVVIPYFLIMLAFRKTINEKFEFSLKKKE